MKLPFAYARRHGVLIDSLTDHAATVLALPTATADAILEVRRVAARPLVLKEVPPQEFNARLQAAYEAQSGDSEQMIADLGSDIDLAALAQELNEPTDLLDSADDAPIIRLINVLFEIGRASCRERVYSSV